jgi:hypothetical protein
MIVSPCVKKLHAPVIPIPCVCPATAEPHPLIRNNQNDIHHLTRSNKYLRHNTYDSRLLGGRPPIQRIYDCLRDFFLVIK